MGKAAERRYRRGTRGRRHDDVESLRPTHSLDVGPWYVSLAPLDAANVKGLAVRAVEAEAPMVNDLAVTYTCQQCVSRTSPHKNSRCHLHLSAMR